MHHNFHSSITYKSQDMDIYIYIYIYIYIHTHTHTPRMKKNETLLFATTVIDFEGITLSEIS